jgi:hypothetical protein
MLAHKENGKWGPLRTEENVRRREGRAGTRKDSAKRTRAQREMFETRGENELKLV